MGESENETENKNRERIREIVTPRSQGYGDVMATYIREVKTRSYIENDKNSIEI